MLSSLGTRAELLVILQFSVLIMGLDNAGKTTFLEQVRSQGALREASSRLERTGQEHV